MNGTVLLAVVLNGAMGVLCILNLIAEVHVGWLICAGLNFATIALVWWLDYRAMRRKVLGVFE